MTRWELHVVNWKDCRRCSLAETRRNVCLARGQLKCDVLFCGEGPGESEDTLSQPFVGPAGQLLDTIVDAAFSRYPTLTWAMTNLVACIPRNEDGAKAGQPDPVEVESCKPRLRELVTIAAPRLIVAVGALAERWLPHLLTGLPIPEFLTAAIVHPSWILRINASRQGLEAQRARIVIENAIEDMLAGNVVPF